MPLIAIGGSYIVVFRKAFIFRSNQLLYQQDE